MRRPTSLRGEDGFTLIELLVGMLLLALLLGAAVAGVISMSTSTDELGADRKAQRQALDAIETMRRDISAARSPALARWNGTRDDLRDVAFHFTDRTGPSDARTMCNNAKGSAFLGCMRAIVVARPNELWLRAEARATTPGAECVGYVVSKGALRRYVSSNWRACGPALKSASSTVETRLIVAKQLSGTNGVFAYTLRYNSTAAGAPGFAPNTIPSIASCRTFVNPRSQNLLNSDTRRASFIASVEVNLTGIATQRGGAAVTELTSSVPVSGHVAGEHVYAVGCSY